ncbi:MAG TPA: M48 family metalloprotease [Terriglobales bacterium]|nr:M48 family metalloprotease [Terriglobales bacterium]
MRRYRILLEVRSFALFTIPILVAASGAADRISFAVLSFGVGLYPAVAVQWVALYAAMLAVELPISALQYWLDCRFQVARGSVGRRLVDALKANVFGFFFGLAVIESVFFAMNLTSDYGWVLAAAIVSLLHAVLVYVVPSLLPLFYRLAPLANSQLVFRLKALAQRAGVEVGDIYEWHISGRTRRANALVAGFGRSRKVIVTDTMLENFSEEEIESLIAHEFGHCAHGDIVKRMLFATLLFLPIFWIAHAIVTFQLVPAPAGWTNPGLVPVFWCVWLYLTLGTNLLKARLTRQQERRADRFAWEHIPSVLPFIPAMKKITALNLITFEKSSEWKYTHPATPDRITAAEQYARDHGQLADAAAV